MKRYVFKDALNPKHVEPRIIETTCDYVEIECPKGFRLFSITKI